MMHVWIDKALTVCTVQYSTVGSLQVLTDADIEEGKFSIEDVVLPLFGYSTSYCVP